MGAGAKLQEALVGALGQVADLQGIYDGAPARAAYPYVVVDAGQESDWGHKSGAGREVRVALTLWDEEPERLYALADAVEAAAGAVGAVSGWQLVSMALVRRQVRRDVAGPWAVAIDWRARLLAD